VKKPLLFCLLVGLLNISYVATAQVTNTFKTSPARNIAVGQYRYDITLKTLHAHDGETDNTYFIVTRANSHTRQCSGTRQIINRQGEVQTTGEYAIQGRYLRFKQRSFGPRTFGKWVVADSTVTTFSPDRTGQFQLLDCWEYTQGKSKKVTF
jgi:hypothetical protein